jgi:hypothetical protein
MSAVTIPAHHPALYPCSVSTIVPVKPPLAFDAHDPGGQSLRSVQSTGLGIRRRANHQQGRALEILGHAVEYLVDSRMFRSEEPTAPADAEALQILMLLSRQVFAECAEVVPLAHRLRIWIDKRIGAASS